MPSSTNRVPVEERIGQLLVTKYEFPKIKVLCNKLSKEGYTITKSEVEVLKQNALSKHRAQISLEQRIEDLILLLQTTSIQCIEKRLHQEGYSNNKRKNIHEKVQSFKTLTQRMYEILSTNRKKTIDSLVDDLTDEGFDVTQAQVVAFSKISLNKLHSLDKLHNRITFLLCTNEDQDNESLIKTLQSEGCKNSHENIEEMIKNIQRMEEKLTDILLEDETKNVRDLMKEVKDENCHVSSFGVVNKLKNHILMEDITVEERLEQLIKEKERSGVESLYRQLSFEGFTIRKPQVKNMQKQILSELHKSGMKKRIYDLFLDYNEIDTIRLKDCLTREGFKNASEKKVSDIVQSIMSMKQRIYELMDVDEAKSVDGLLKALADEGYEITENQAMKLRHEALQMKLKCKHDVKVRITNLLYNEKAIIDNQNPTIYDTLKREGCKYSEDEIDDFTKDMHRVGNRVAELLDEDETKSAQLLMKEMNGENYDVSLTLLEPIKKYTLRQIRDKKRVQDRNGEQMMDQLSQQQKLERKIERIIANDETIDDIRLQQRLYDEGFSANTWDLREIRQSVLTKLSMTEDRIYELLSADENMENELLCQELYNEGFILKRKKIRDLKEKVLRNIRIERGEIENDET